MNIIPDPDFEGFDGIFIGAKKEKDNLADYYDIPGLVHYARDKGKPLKELTEEEIRKFKK